MHLGLCVVFAYSFAYHRGWNACLEVWGEIQGLSCTLWKSGVKYEVIQSSGTKVAVSEYSLGLDCTIKSLWVNSWGHFCTFQSIGPICKEPEVQGPVLQIGKNWPLLLFDEVYFDPRRWRSWAVRKAGRSGAGIASCRPWRRRRRWLSDGFVVVRARSRLWRRSLARTEHDKTMSHLREPSRHWSRDVKKLSSGLETKKNESELKLVEVRSGLAKRVNEVATSWASAGAAIGSGDVTPLGKTRIR